MERELRLVAARIKHDIVTFDADADDVARGPQRQLLDLAREGGSQVRGEVGNRFERCVFGRKRDGLAACDVPDPEIEDEITPAGPARRVFATTLPNKRVPPPTPSAASATTSIPP